MEKIQSKSLPAIIVRPSIVIPIRHDPIPGWVSIVQQREHEFHEIGSVLTD